MKKYGNADFKLVYKDKILKLVNQFEIKLHATIFIYALGFVCCISFSITVIR